MGVQHKNHMNISDQTFEPHYDQQSGFGTGPTQTELYKHRTWLVAGNFGFGKKRNCTIGIAKLKVL